MDAITSRENTAVKEIQKLSKSTKHRLKNRLFVIEGARLCEDALQSGIKIQKVCIMQDALEKHAQLIDRLCDGAKKTYIFQRNLFSALSDLVTPQGILCVCRMREESFHLEDGSYIGLESIRDPQNMGTILRTAEALGITGVVMSKDCCDIYSPKVLRGSMGAVFRLNYMVTDDLPAYALSLQLNGFTTFGAVADRGAPPVTKLSLSKEDKAAVVIGNEGNGLSQELLDACAEETTIPMGGRAESLNAATAASIVMWEMVRERI